MFEQSTFSIIASVAKSRGINAAALAAVVEVESNGIPYAYVDGISVPVIRIEGHYFDRLVAASKQKVARAAGLASPKASAIKNPKEQADRYRMFQRMCDIDKNAAIMSCSWGVGQVMGVHWQKLRFNSADEFYAFITSGLRSQVEVMVRFIEYAGLIDEIERQDWAGFARIYNGPRYRDNKYDVKIAAAYARYGGMQQPSPASGMLRSGSSGASVREVQTLLQRGGYTVTVDGDFGPATRQAVKEFQKNYGLEVDGVVGPKTQQALKAFQLSPDEQPGAQSPASVPAVKNAVKGGGAIAIILSIREQIGEAASSLSGMGVKLADDISSGLMVASGGIGICLAGYALYGLLKSQQTVEQG